jgi:cytosine/adenosine deaminase-related metal-dependent hydrolase
VRKSLLQLSASFAREHFLPLAIHIAETQEELHVLQGRSGPLVEFLSALGAWDPDGLVTDPQEALDIVAEVDRLLLIHANYLAPTHRALGNGTIVYCPRTHARFGNPPYPINEFMRSGVRLALGTDGLGSAPDLDVLAEARFLHQAHPEVAPEAVMAMMTIHGALGLGWGGVAGTLEPGKSADLIGVPLRGATGPCQALLESADLPREVMFCGQWVFAAPSSPVGRA